MLKEKEILTKKDTLLLETEPNFSELIEIVDKIFASYAFTKIYSPGRTEISIPGKRTKMEIRAISAKDKYTNLELSIKIALRPDRFDKRKNRLDIESSARLVTKTPKSVFEKERPRESFYRAILNFITKFYGRENLSYASFADKVLKEVTNEIRSYLSLPTEARSR